MRLFVAVFALLGVGAASARADLIITLDDSAQTGHPGDTLVFTGTLSNTGGATIFLNSVDLNLAGNSFTVDFIDPFLNNVPFSLDPAQATSSIELFDVTLNNPFTDLLATYAGSYSLLGGVDSDSQDVLDSVDFTASATSSATGTPEPSSVALLAIGLSFVAIAHRRRRTA